MDLPAFDNEFWFDCGCVDAMLELGDEWLCVVAMLIFDFVEGRLGIDQLLAIDEFTNCG